MANNAIAAPSRPSPFSDSPTSASLIYKVYPGNNIDDALLEQCAKLFTNNYGIWGQSPTDVKGPKPGLLHGAPS